MEQPKRRLLISLLLIGLMAYPLTAASSNDADAPASHIHPSDDPAAVSAHECSSRADWWNRHWSYRMELTFDNSDQSRTLVNFPVLVTLSPANFDYSRAEAGGSDLRFIDADGSTELTYHIEEWNPSGSSYVWVNVTGIDGGSFTDRIWMYYDNPGAPDVQDPAGTYDDDYLGVWHLNEIFGAHADSTSNGNRGTPSGGVAQDASGPVAGADRFDGIDDVVDCGADGSLDPGSAVTVEAWVDSALAEKTTSLTCEGTYTTGHDIESVSAVLADVDDDGEAEIVTASKDTNVYILNHSGSSVSLEASHATGGEVKCPPAVADVDGDGTPEVVVGGKDSKVHVLSHDGSSITSEATYTAGDFFEHAGTAIADVDDDGELEIIIGCKDDKVYVLNHSGSAVSMEASYTTGGDVKTTPSVADVDGDGELEIVIGSNDDNLYVLQHTGSSLNLEASVTAGGDFEGTPPAIADVDGDGQLEIVVGNRDTDLHVYSHSGSSLSLEASYNTGGEIKSSPAIGDVDGDGQLEIVTGSKDTYIYVLNHSGSALSLEAKYSTGNKLERGGIALADVDGDRTIEIVAGSWDSKLYVLRHTGTALVCEDAYATGGELKTEPSIGDVDGDGELEIVVGCWDNKVYVVGSGGSSHADWTMHGCDLNVTNHLEYPYGMISKGDSYGLRASPSRVISHVNTGRSSGALGEGWTHVAMTYDGASLRTYVDGALASAEPLAGAISADAGALLFGERFKGRLDEVRVSKKARSSDWLAAQYLSMRDDFVTCGPEESKMDGEPGPVAEIVLDPPGMVTLGPGEARVFEAVGYDVFGNINTTWADSWSTDAALGSLGDTGGLTMRYNARLAGVDGINVSCPATGAWAKAVINVVPGPVTSVEIYSHPSVWLEAGTSTVFTATGRDAYGNVNDTWHDTWSLDDGGAGLTDLGGYSARFYSETAAVEHIQVSCPATGALNSTEVTVTPGPLEKMRVKPGAATVPARGQMTFKARGSDRFGNAVVPTDTVWETNAGVISGSTASSCVLTAGSSPMGDGWVRASQGAVSQTALVDVVETYDPPVIVGTIPDQLAVEDCEPWPLDLSQHFSDEQEPSSELRWYVTDGNPSLVQVTGERIWGHHILMLTPLPDAHGSDRMTIWLEDSDGEADSQDLWVNVTPVNDAPVLQAIPPQTGREGQPWRLDLTEYCHDVDDPFPSLAITTDADEAYVDGTDLVFTGSPGSPAKVHLTVRDGSLAVAVDIELTIVPDGGQDGTGGGVPGDGTGPDGAATMGTDGGSGPEPGTVEYYVTSIAETIRDHSYAILAVILFTFFILIALIYATVYRVEEVFLIHRERGIVIHYLSHTEEETLDKDLIGGMLTAFNTFVKDVFARKGEGTVLRSGEAKEPDLTQFNIGEDKKVMLELGDELYLAVIYRGSQSRLRLRLRRVIARLERKYGDVYKDWDGGYERLGGTKEIVGKLLTTPIAKELGRQSFAYRKRARSRTPPVKSAVRSTLKGRSEKTAQESLKAGARKRTRGRRGAPVEPAEEADTAGPTGGSFLKGWRRRTKVQEGERTGRSRRGTADRRGVGMTHPTPSRLRFGEPEDLDRPKRVKIAGLLGPHRDP